ncbi:UNVERIFIED_CONTAM: hypothetical protein K2H54_027038 [Gekko kuhli]
MRDAQLSGRNALPKLLSKTAPMNSIHWVGCSLDFAMFTTSPSCLSVSSAKVTLCDNWTRSLATNSQSSRWTTRQTSPYDRIITLKRRRPGVLSMRLQVILVSLPGTMEAAFRMHPTSLPDWQDSVSGHRMSMTPDIERSTATVESPLRIPLVPTATHVPRISMPIDFDAAICLSALNTSRHHPLSAVSVTESLGAELTSIPMVSGLSWA